MWIEGSVCQGEVSKMNLILSGFIIIRSPFICLDQNVEKIVKKPISFFDYYPNGY
jgi:hypothetical protein